MGCDVSLIRQNHISQHGSTCMTSTSNGSLSYGDDSDSYPSQRSKFTSLGEDDAPLCLYYAALCGFRDLTRYLITKYPQHVDATVGLNKSPLAAALRNRHIQVAELLHQHGAVLPIGYKGRTLLHAASADGLVDVAKWLLEIGADANAQAGRPHGLHSHLAAANGHLGHCSNRYYAARCGCQRTGSKPVDALASRIVRGMLKLRSY